MSTILFANNGSSRLAGGITSVALTAALTPGSGVLFPAPGAGQFFVMTFIDAATGILNEIVHVTNVTGDVITMIRAQEGTTALAWQAGDFALNLVTAGTMDNFPQTPVPNNYCLLQEQQASGVNAGVFNSGGWVTRALNVKAFDTAGIIVGALAGGQFTLGPGTYSIRASAPAGNVNRHQTRLQNITGAATLLLGTSENATTNAQADVIQTRSDLDGEFTLGTQSAIALQHQAESTSGDSQGLGSSNTFGVQVYSQAVIQQVA